MKTKNTYSSPLTFAQWQAFSRSVHECAARIKNERDVRAWALAATVGIPRDMCCLHNASIDDNMTGWCAGNPVRLKVAKRVNYIVGLWTEHRLAERISARAFNRVNRSATSL